jgi:hypothetical protein
MIMHTSSTIIQDLTSHCDSNSSVAYFYFDFHDSAKQRYEILVRSLITQLSDQSVGTPEALEILFSSCQDGKRQPTVNALVTTLQSILRSFRESYIVIDALDECTSREELLGLIQEIVGWNMNTLHFLVTSRKEREIEDGLKGHVSSQINIQSSLVATDIQIYVHEKLRLDPKWQKWPEKVRAEIEATLMDGAHGM